MEKSGTPKKEFVYEISSMCLMIRNLKETLMRGFGRSDHDKQYFRGFSLPWKEESEITNTIWSLQTHKLVA